MSPFDDPDSAWLCLIEDPDEPSGELYIRTVHSAAMVAAFMATCQRLDQKAIVRPYSSVLSINPYGV